MITSLNSKPCNLEDWPTQFQPLWASILAKLTEGEVVTNANAFTSRPYKNEYDRGSRDHGIVYTINHRHVWMVKNSEDN